MASKFDRIIKENIARRRKLLKITQNEMSVRLGMDRNAYRNIETGKTAIVHERLDAIAEILGVDAESLILGYSPLDLESDPRLEEFKRDYSIKTKEEADSYSKEIIRLKAALIEKDRIISLMQDSLNDKTAIINYLKSRKNT